MAAVQQLAANPKENNVALQQAVFAMLRQVNEQQAKQAQAAAAAAAQQQQLALLQRLTEAASQPPPAVWPAQLCTLTDVC